MLSSLWAKIVTGGAILLGILFAIGRIFSAGKRSERRRNDVATEREKNEALQDEKIIEGGIADLTPDERRDGLRVYTSDSE